MNGRAFLGSARLLLSNPSEANRRTAAGRAYYGLLHEGRAALERWRFLPRVGMSVHSFVRLRFQSPNHRDLQGIAVILDNLATLRNRADYDLLVPGRFASDRDATDAV